MATLLCRALKRPLVHIQKSLYIQSSIALKSLNFHDRRHFAEDPKDVTSTTTTTTTTTVIEQEREKEETMTAIEQVEEFEMPPIRPSYQTKTPMELIAEVPIIEVDAQFVKCDGLWFESDMTRSSTKKIRHPKEGHPTQWINLNTRKPFNPQTCKYCGLRFVMKKPHNIDNFPFAQQDTDTQQQDTTQPQ